MKSDNSDKRAEIIPDLTLNSPNKESIYFLSSLDYATQEHIIETLIDNLYNGSAYTANDYDLKILGTFCLLFQRLQRTKNWKEIQKLTKNNMALSTLIIQEIFPLISKLYTQYRTSNLFINDLQKLELNNIDQALQELLLSQQKTQTAHNRNKTLNNQDTTDKTKNNNNNNNNNNDNDNDNNNNNNTFDNNSDTENKQILQSDPKNFQENLEMLIKQLTILLKEIKQDFSGYQFANLFFNSPGWDLTRKQLKKEDISLIRTYTELSKSFLNISELLEPLHNKKQTEGEGTQTLTSIYQALEIGDFTLSNKLDSLFLSELIQLIYPKTKLLFLQKYIQAKLLSYQMTGPATNEQNGKQPTPLIILIDCSGSMQGAGEKIGKALTLKILSQLKKHNTTDKQREIRIGLFSSIKQLHLLTVNMKENNLENILDFLRYSFKGGTDYDSVLTDITSLIKNNTKLQPANILFITDSMANILNSKTTKTWNYSKEKIVNQLITVEFGTQTSQSLTKLADIRFKLEIKHISHSKKENTALLVKRIK